MLYMVQLDVTDLQCGPVPCYYITIVINYKSIVVTWKWIILDVDDMQLDHSAVGIMHPYIVCLCTFPIVIPTTTYISWKAFYLF